jgi:hypothetical protein
MAAWKPAAQSYAAWWRCTLGPWCRLDSGFRAIVLRVSPASSAYTKAYTNPFANTVSYTKPRLKGQKILFSLYQTLILQQLRLSSFCKSLVFL